MLYLASHCATRMRCQPLDDEDLEQPASLVELPVPKVCRLDQGVASPSCAYATLSPLSSSSLRYRCTDKIPFGVAPSQVPTAARPRCALLPLMHAHAVRAQPCATHHATPCRAILSLPVHTPIKGDHTHCLSSAPRSSCPLRSACVVASVFFIAAAVDSLAHPSSPPVRRSPDTARARSYSLSHWTPTFPTEESLRRRCAGELSPRRRPSPSVRFQDQHLAAPSHHGPWTHPMRIFTLTVQPLVASARVAPH
jgi:hypothetical protein